jgi:hypothetical protein
LLTAVHAQLLALAWTATLPVAPAGETVALAGFSVNAHAPA